MSMDGDDNGTSGGGMGDSDEGATSMPGVPETPAPGEGDMDEDTGGDTGTGSM